jgi:hypothetical protein
LKRDHAELFELLQLTVKKLGVWTKEDIAWNDAEWVQLQNNTSLSTEQPAPFTNSSIELTEVDEIPNVIRAMEERLAKKRSYTVRPMFNTVFLTHNKLLHPTRTSRLKIANSKKPALILVDFSPAFSRLNPVATRRLQMTESSGCFQRSHTAS